MSEDKMHSIFCSPGDKTIVWHCDKCGLNESAEQEFESLRRHIEEAREMLTQVEKHQPCDICGSFKYLNDQRVHYPDCKLKAWLKNENAPR